MAIEIEATRRAIAPRRRFTLLDGMILVAATAVGMALMQVLAHVFGWGDLPGQVRDRASSGEFLALNLILLVSSLPMLAAWTMALVPLRLLKPRPRFRRLACQPGLTAGIAVIAAMGFEVVPILVAVWIGVLRDMEWILYCPLFFGVAVVASWTNLIVGRRWRPEASWIDRLGRALGAFWILFTLASPVLWMVL